MHIFKIETKITDLSLGKVRPEVGKLWPLPIFCVGQFLFVFNQILNPFNNH